MFPAVAIFGSVIGGGMVANRFALQNEQEQALRKADPPHPTGMDIPPVPIRERFWTPEVTQNRLVFVTSFPDVGGDTMGEFYNPVTGQRVYKTLPKGKPVSYGLGEAV